MNTTARARPACSRGSSCCTASACRRASTAARGSSGCSRNTLDWDAHPYFQGIRGLEVSATSSSAATASACKFVALDAAPAARRRSSCSRARELRFSVGIELEGLEGDLFTDAQYAALAALLAALRERLPALRAVAGLSTSPPERKPRPGPASTGRG